MNRIRIDLDRRLGAIDRNIFGSFVEHLGRCVYGGIYEPDAPNADANGLRADVRDAIKRLGVSQIRYPGGNFVSGYRWRDGIGAVEERPARADLAWASFEPNTFGTNEFVRFCRTVEAEPYFVVNAGDGDLREARDWVEYCNGTADTALVRERASHGHPEPHRVRYWGVGNEVDGHWQIGAKTASEYARTYHEFAKVMRWADPSIQLVASAASDWNTDVTERAQALVEECGELIDAMSIHWYVGNQTGDTARYLATSELVEERLSAYEGLMRGLTLGSGGKRLERGGGSDARRVPIPLAVDEWNVWYRTAGANNGTPPNLLEEVYDLADALVVGMHLNAFVRHSGTVRMANLAQLVNVIAPIVTRPGALVLQTTFHPFELFSRTTGPIALDAWWDGDTFDAAGYGAVRTLDVSASLDPDARRLSIHAVNRDRDQPIEATVEVSGATLGGQAQVSTITGPDLAATNTFDQPDCVATATTSVDLASSAGRFQFTFPARSVTGLVLTV